MTPEQRAELVREARLELKRLSHKPRYGRENADQYVQRTSDFTDGGIFGRLTEWDQGRQRLPRRQRRRVPRAPRSNNDYVGYMGLGPNGQPRNRP